MELLTQNLPSGVQYEFSSIKVTPMRFAQILEYLENVPKNQVEKYYFDYCLVKGKEGDIDYEPNIDQLLLNDLEYVIYFKKALTISENLDYNTSVPCPRCGSQLSFRTTLANLTFNKLDDQLKTGFQIMFHDRLQTVRMPRVYEFMEIFKKYRLYKKVEDMRLIKLISLFESSSMYLQMIENQVINATYKDVTALIMLEDLYFNIVEPVKLFCKTCADSYKLTESDIFKAKKEYGIKEEDDLPSMIYEEIQAKHGGVEIRVDSLVSNFFRDLTQNNRLTQQEILPREVRQDE